MSEKKKKTETKETKKIFEELLDKHVSRVPKAGEVVLGTVLSASRAEVKLDIDGVFVGVVRGREMYEEADEYANLKPGDKVEATVIEEENENSEFELSFRYAGQEKAWKEIKEAYKNKEAIKVKVIDANRGGLLVKFKQIAGFIPVSQLSPENYPRVSGGDKTRILEKLKSFVDKEMVTKIINLDDRGEKIVFSEKEAWNETQKDVIAKYKIGSAVKGKITAITNFGIFITFGDNLEGLIHISELAWQRIDDPSELFKVGEEIKAEIINIEGAKIFLSVKKLIKDPWSDVGKKYKVGQKVKTTILKINPFGLFVELDKDIHGLAHASRLNLSSDQKINQVYKEGSKVELVIISIEPKEHRLGLAIEKKDDDWLKAKKDSVKPAKKESAKKAAKPAKMVKSAKEAKKDSVKPAKKEPVKPKAKK